MLGWLALRDEFGWEPGIFFGIQFICNSSFWSIAWIRFEDYKKAGINLLPTKKNKDHKTAFQMCFFIHSC